MLMSIQEISEDMPSNGKGILQMEENNCQDECEPVGDIIEAKGNERLLREKDYLKRKELERQVQSGLSSGVQI